MPTADGEHRTGVSQQPYGGTDYPFQSPDPAGAVLLDFFLSYPDDHCGFELPLRVDWLYGFGDVPNAAPPGTPAAAGPVATPVFPDATDGYVHSYDDSGPTYSVARNGTGSSVAVAGDVVLVVGQRRLDSPDPMVSVFQSFLAFDLLAAGIPAGDTVSGVTLEIWPTQNLTPQDFTIEVRALDWSPPLAAGDFVPGDDLAGLPLLAAVPTDGLSVGAYLTIPANGTALRDAVRAALAGDGVLRLLVASSRTRTNDEPVVGLPEWISFSSADEAGTGQDPRLTVTHTAHPQDLRVVDARGAVVFDSTTGTYAAQAWGANREVVEWVTGEAVARAVRRTDNTADFARHITPVADLIARTADRLPRRLRSLTVEGVHLAGAVEFVGGYNVAFTPEAAAATDGGRRQTAVTVDAGPGAGLGRFPGCEDLVAVIKKVNQVGPTEGGRFRVKADECYRLQLRAHSFGDGSAAFDDPYGLELFNDCEPCCDCHAFVRVYKGLARVWRAWENEARRAESARDLYQAGVTRWEAQAACRAAQALRVVVVSEGGCKVGIGAVLCNMRPCCVRGLEIRFTLASPTITAATVSDGHVRPGASSARDYALAGGWPTVSAFVDRLRGQESIAVSFRLCATGCADGDDLSVAVKALANAVEPEPFTGATCDVEVTDDGLLLAQASAGHVALAVAPEKFGCGC